MKIIFFAFFILSSAYVFADDTPAWISLPAVSHEDANKNNLDLDLKRRLEEEHLCGSQTICSTKSERIANPPILQAETKSDTEILPSKVAPNEAK